MMLLSLVLGTALALEERELESGGLHVTASHGWPAVSQGYWPLQVRVENRRSRPANLDVQVALEDLDVVVSQPLSLDPGEVEQVELLVPAFTLNYSSGTRLRLVEGTRVALKMEPPGPQQDARTAGLFVAALVSAEGAETARLLGLLDAAETTPFDPARLPSSGAAYVGLETILVDGPLPSGDARGALLSWMKLGGTLILVNTPAADLAAPDVRAWLEDRFTVNVESEVLTAAEEKALAAATGQAPSLRDAYEELKILSYIPVNAEWDGEGPRGRRLVGAGISTWYQAGRGDLVVMSPHSERSRREMAEALRGRGNSDLHSDPGLWNDPSLMTRVQALPARTISILLVAVAALLGPGNLMLLRRLRRPTLLLATAPGLALACTGGLLSWWYLQQGLETRAASFSLTILDHRTGTASTLAWHRVFSGISQDLQPQPGTWIVPTTQVDDEFTLRAQHGPDGAVFSGDLLPTRTVAHLVVASDQPLSEGALKDPLPSAEERIERGFDGKLRRLIRDGSGGPRMEEISSEEAARHMGAAALMLGDANIPPGSYLARIEGGAFADDMGLPLEDVGGERWVLGVLPAESP